MTLGSNTLTGSNALLVGSTGNGTVILAGTNNYTGSINVMARTLALGIPGGFQRLQCHGQRGTLDLGGSSTPAGTVTLQSGVMSDGSLSRRPTASRASAIRPAWRGGSPDQEHHGYRHPQRRRSYGGGTTITGGNLSSARPPFPPRGTSPSTTAATLTSPEPTRWPATGSPAARSTALGRRLR